MKISFLSSVAVAALLLAGCSSEDDNKDKAVVSYADKVTASGSTLPYTVLAAPSDAFEIRNGGYGSAATAHPTNVNLFYAITDRGPNADYTGADGKGKMFPVPDYTPRIGLFELTSDGSVKQIKDILLKDRDGNLISGLPNSSGLGGTGEIPYDSNGSTIKNSDGTIAFDDYGLDSEGLVALNDGTFWVSDEYGPHMVHFDADGKEIGRINPFTEDNRTQFNLPAEFANRRANRGMEGLAVTPDQKTLVGIMQSTMYNPDKTVKSLDITRIVTINVDTGAVGQYLYKQEAAARSNSEIAALSATEFLVIERDGTFLADNPDAQKEIYKIDLSTGTNLETVSLSAGMEQNATHGLTIDGKTLEQVVLADGNWDTLTAKGIVPVSKTLVVDMVSEVSYPHDKMEGLWIIDSNTIGVLNDDDFATTENNGELEQKYLIPTTTIDSNTLYVVRDLNLTSK